MRRPSAELSPVAVSCGHTSFLFTDPECLFYFIVFYFTLFHFIFYYFITLFYFIFYFIFHYFILFHFIFYYFISFFIILFYFIFCFVLFHFPGRLKQATVASQRVWST